MYNEKVMDVFKNPKNASQKHHYIQVHFNLSAKVRFRLSFSLFFSHTFHGLFSLLFPASLSLPTLYYRQLFLS